MRERKKERERERERKKEGERRSQMGVAQGNIATAFAITLENTCDR